VKVTLVEGGNLAKIRGWAMGMTVAILLRSPATDIDQVWNGISDARIDFNATAPGINRGDGLSQMARLTETLNLQRALLRHLRDQPNVTPLDNTKVKSIFKDDVPGGGWPMVQLSDGTTLRA
jgi:ubiquinone biosynthesis monooxygenase Coq6